MTADPAGTEPNGVDLVPAAGRSCGTCTLCCKLFDIRALDKPRFEWCKHCAVGHGCNIYEQRPDECRAFNCSYLLNPDLGEEWKPSKSKIVLTLEKGNVIGVYVDPGRADAWRKEPYHSQIRRWAAEAAGKRGQVIVWEGRNVVALLPGGDKRLGPVPDGHHIVFSTRRGPGGNIEPDAIVVAPDDPQLQEADFDRMLGTKQDAADAYFNRGLAYAARGDAARAIAEFDFAIRRDPTLGPAYDARGLARAQLGQLDEALADYDRAIEMAPDNAGFHNNRAVALAASGRTGEAMAAFEIAVRLDPGYARAYFNRGAAHDEAGDWERAIADFSRAIDVDPRYARAYTERAALHFRLGRFAEAAADFEATARLDPGQRPAWQLWHHVARARAGLPGRALPAGAGEWPEPMAALFRGELGRAEALEAAAPGDPASAFFVGQYFLLQGDEEAAADHFRRAVKSGDVTSYARAAASAELGRLGVPAA